MTTTLVLTLSLALAAPPALMLEDVMDTVNAHHPLLRAAEDKIDVARAQEWEQLGAYDLQLGAGAQTNVAGYYDEQTVKGGLTQALPGWGRSEFDVEYRYGRDLPDYAGKSITGTLGEVSTRIRVQLLKDLWTDDVRRGRAQAEISRMQSEIAVRQKRLDLQAKAVKAYWKWFVAGREVRIAEDLVALANDRNSFVRLQAERGMRARIDIVDNERQLLSRQEKLLESRLKLRQAALELSVYLRDDEGNPRIPRDDELPSIENIAMPPVHEAPAVLLETLERLRPEFAVLAMETKRTRVDEDWALNQALPKIEVEAGASQDLGTSVPSPNVSATLNTEVGVGVKFAFPLQSRKARGKLLQARGKNRVLQEEARYLRDVVAAEVNASLAALDVGYSRVTLASKALAASRQLEAAERTKMEAGQTDLLTVNLRETATASDAVRVADAVAALHLAHANLQLALGRAY